jgi:hypothetical protein
MILEIAIALMSPVRMGVSYEAERELCVDVGEMLRDEVRLGRRGVLDVELHIKRCNEFEREFDSWG